MTSRFLLIVACGCALLGSVAVAHAASKHKLNDTVEARVLTANSKLVVYTGTVKDKANGAGAVVTQSTPTGTAGKFNQVVTAFFSKGLIRLKGFTVATSNADGSTTYTGTVKAVSGTGRYKGVAGSLKLAGSAPASDATFATFKVTGSLTY